MNKEIETKAQLSAQIPAVQIPDSCGSESQELLWWLALHRAPGIGPSTFHALLKYFDSPQDIFSARSADLLECGLRNNTCQYLKQPDWKKVEQDLAWLEQPDNHILTFIDKDYPEMLKKISLAPPVLFIHGQIKALQTLQIAMVGSRNPSLSGCQTAEKFAHYLASSGFTITSGLALGIDAASHEGALKAGGATIAVTGTGLDRVYPARHRDLAHRIAERGALISEFPIGTAPLAAHFPRRNRVISGLSLGTLVVEAAQKSGSLITAQHALEQGREVFAIPGSIHNPMAKGCHQLIRQGAKLVETADDILSELDSLTNVQHALTNQTNIDNSQNSQSQETANKNEDGLELDPEYQKLINNMGYDEVAVDELVDRCQLAPESVSSMLLIMELQGYVTSGPGGLYSLVHK